MRMLPARKLAAVWKPTVRKETATTGAPHRWIARSARRNFAEEIRPANLLRRAPAPASHPTANVPPARSRTMAYRAPAVSAISSTTPRPELRTGTRDARHPHGRPAPTGASPVTVSHLRPASARSVLWVATCGSGTRTCTPGKARQGQPNRTRIRGYRARGE